MRTSNPFLKEQAFTKSGYGFKTESEVMTVDSTINKFFILLLLVIFSAGFAWIQVANNLSLLYPFLIVGAIGGLITVLIASFNPKASPYLSPIYAILEGLFLGSISMVVGSQYSGIVFQAVLLTLAVFMGMFFLYKFGVIKVTEQLRSGIILATFGIAMVYLMGWILRMFGLEIPFIHEGGWFGIGFSLFVIGIASLNLVLDFDNIDRNASHHAPKYMEWFAAMGLIITLVWLYVEILRLLMKLQSSD
jgi:uncharacterized YccA/Bax inhibitor family protein